ncbi:hypothetical protein D3C78_1696650 [compost metagenome]
MGTEQAGGAGVLDQLQAQGLIGAVGGAARVPFVGNDDFADEGTGAFAQFLQFGRQSEIHPGYLRRYDR